MQTNITVVEWFQKSVDDDFGRKIEQWIDAPDSSKNYFNALEKHQKDTCSWFINGPQFADWKNQGLPFIWVYGIPGCGKSVL
ncbi:hypothetical protein HETIRDRAFT_164637 [Heterobasidion irregulare TC 32-1]|uniref:Nephrocystin 3-like N-terminal domain-containing protein n=1 Tax=Heterobasidion irregulare (strain TC 32-1) TaxID=747525 RepID=W4JQP5_HETIT|nr:uncharacterized protein HETIRDRAFT_164637 [Heterobasidion irregulare TC 32-1]ETW75216.1 hypothetical protein HETIRDRAFT_164637 [Heterobasidion irregulare TC 32-1]